MKNLLDSLETFIKKHHLFGAEDSLLVALSGGVDSIVLTHMLSALGYHVAVAHCNFELRGKAADQDAQFVQKFAKHLHLTFYQKNFDTRAYATKHKISTQMAARQLRYAWFDQLMHDHDHRWLVTAHHANDQVETVLYNLTKGTGIAGIRGIPLKRNKVVRPLLFAHRPDIEAYAEAHRLKWREDASNQEDKYSRNKLRLHVIPLLKQINPGLEQTLLRTSQRFEAVEQILGHQVALIKNEHLSQNKGSYSLNLSWYYETFGGLAIMIELLRPFGFNADQCISITERLDQGIGKQFFSSDYVLAIDRGKLEIVPKADNTQRLAKQLHATDEFLSTPWADFSLEFTHEINTWPKEKHVACLDADLIKFPLKVRNWHEGDAFQPLGMKGKKKLSDFMIDEKIPVNLKSRVVLFESDQDIVWIAGHRIDDRYKITSNTQQVLIIKMTAHV